MIRRALLFLSEQDGLKPLIFALPGSRAVSLRFVAGDTLQDAVRAASELNRSGFRVTLDFLGESVTDRAEARTASAAYRASLDAIDGSAATSTISLKLTQLGLDIDEAFCEGNLRSIVERAQELDNFVRIDMESSEYTERTLRIFRRVFVDHSNVGVVIQSYLRRSEEDVRELVRLGAPVRLCKGAYQEPAEIAFQDRREVDGNFVTLMRRLLDGGAPTAIATHDDRMIEATLEHVARSGIADDAFEFQMLYGVRRDYQRELVQQGYGMRIYVPYGSQWYSYLMRRMAERPQNLLFGVRAVLGR
ncbi:MAG: proline dehydrogenase family protein [Gemmatimonadota bacterium]|nr:MAG: proline dehydrogenase family protein [Gemmatimonadota bacterium]